MIERGQMNDKEHVIYREQVRESEQVKERVCETERVRGRKSK